MITFPSGTTAPFPKSRENGDLLLTISLAVVKYFDEHGLTIPTRLWQRERQGEAVWRRLRHARVLSILHNPFYAGAYVYGRTQTRQRPLPGRSTSVRCWLVEVAGGEAGGLDLAPLGLFLSTSRQGARAAGMEAATRRWLHRVRDLAVDHLAEHGLDG